jgi:4-amino-4-deoxy-L-arabinose transferase-like glycosyltransferase
MFPRLTIPLLALIVFFSASVPRLLGLGIFVTPDEPLWITTSANFYRAWQQGDFTNTYQREHPGVTVMYAGMFAFMQHLPDYPSEVMEYLNPDTPSLDEWLRANTSFTALDFLVTARQWIALWIALTFALLLIPVQRLFGAGLAVWVVLWAVFDPFHIALSRQLHQDGWLAVLLLLSLFCLLVYVEKSKSWAWLGASAVVMGLAWLTKAPSGVFLPFGILLLFWYGRRNQWTFLAIIQTILVWGGLAGLTSIMLWPALWVAPIESIRQMITVLVYFATEGHGNGVFFLGETSPNPGMGYYPMVYLFRTTPVTLFGLGLAGWTWWQTRQNPSHAATRRIIGICVLFALYFFLIMAWGAKQQERYILTTFLLLDIVAAWGWWMIVQWIWQTLRSQRQWVAIGLAVAILGIQIGSALLEYPYYFTYYNPLLGGRSTAEQVLTIGWGEGMEQAAAWINAQPGENTPTVLSWYDHGSLSYYLNGTARSVTETWSPTVWCDTDYVVTYINQWQRNLPTPEADAYLATLIPTHRVFAQGIEYARIYSLANKVLPDFPLKNDDTRADFGGQIRLTTVDQSAQTTQAGESIRLTLNLQSLVEMDTNYNILVKLIAPDGSEIWRQEGFPWGAPTTDWEECTARPDGYDVAIPADTMVGEYRLTVEFYDPATFAPLVVTEVNRPDTVRSDRAWQVGTITVTP